MIRLILYVVVFVLAIYLLIWLYGRFKRLSPRAKQTILGFGLPWIFRIITAKWRVILGFLWKFLKK